MGDFTEDIRAYLSHFSYPNRADVGASHRLEEVQLLRYRNSFGTSAHAQFAINAADLRFNRIGGNDESLCHLDIGATSHQEP